MDLTRTEAFDMICDKIKDGEQFTADLVAQASDGTPAGYLKLETWIESRNYRHVTSNRVITYVCTRHEKPLRAGAVRRSTVV